MLIPLVDGEIRKRLVNARAKAMQFGSDAGIALLGDNPELSEASRAAILMQHCEILYLDHRFDDACNIYDMQLEPLLEGLSPECVSLLADNRSTIAFELFDAEGSDQFYHQIDMRRLLGVQLSDSSAELEADRKASTGVHHEALPTIWKLLLDAYRRQNWRALHWAHAGMARECMALNWSEEAVWHAVQALDKNLVIEAANHLIASRDGKQIEIATDRLLKFSKLARHASLAAEFFGSIADCIPDDRVARVIDWASVHLDLVPTNRPDELIFEPIWRFVGALGLAGRINSDGAQAIVQKAVSHFAVMRRGAARKGLINSCRRLIQTIAPQHLDQLVDPALSLVTTGKSDFDFDESLNLICQLAEKVLLAMIEFYRNYFRQELGNYL